MLSYTTKAARIDRTTIMIEVYRFRWFYIYLFSTLNCLIIDVYILNLFALTLWFFSFSKCTMLAAAMEPGIGSIQRCHLTSIRNPIVEIRWSYDRLISIMGFPILIRWQIYNESGTCDMRKFIPDTINVEYHLCISGCWKGKLTRIWL